MEEFQDLKQLVSMYEDQCEKKITEAPSKEPRCSTAGQKIFKSLGKKTREIKLINFVKLHFW